MKAYGVRDGSISLGPWASYVMRCVYYGGDEDACLRLADEEKKVKQPMCKFIGLCLFQLV